MELLHFIQTNIDSKVKSINDLPFTIHKLEFKKNEVLTNFNQTENRVYFMTKGIAYSFAMNSKKLPSVIDFYFPSEFFNSYTSFIQQTGSETKIVALTNCSVEYLDHDEIQTLYKTSLFVNQLGRKLTEVLCLKKIRREIDFLTKSASERYKELYFKHPRIIQDVPNKKIAMYLGIHAESLSRIRKQIST